MEKDFSDSDSELSSYGKSVEHIECEPKIDVRSTKNNLKSVPYSCDYQGCNKVFHRPSKLMAHKWIHDNKRPYQCKIVGCGKAYTNSSHLKRHIKVCHDKTAPSSSFKCTEAGCDAVLKTKQFLTRHIKRKHTDFPFKCTDCDAMFKRSRHLKEHTFIHNGIHPYFCEICNQGFEKMYLLKRHQRIHRTFPCRFEACSEVLKSSLLLRKHMAQVHKPECAVCDKKFANTNNLREHVITNHIRESDVFVCYAEGCNKTFTRDKYLKQHIEHVHERLHEYRCPAEGCGKIFPWKRSLLIHVKQHSSTIRFKKPRKVQSTRKDKGEAKLSIAAELSNVSISVESHEKLISKNTVDTDGSVSDASAVSEVIYFPLSSTTMADSCSSPAKSTQQVSQPLLS